MLILEDTKILRYLKIYSKSKLLIYCERWSLYDKHIIEKKNGKHKEE